MSEATKELHELARKLTQQWRPTSKVGISVVAYRLVEQRHKAAKTQREKIRFEHLVSSAQLNTRLFLSEAKTPESRLIHEAVITAVLEFKQAQEKPAKKEAQHGISRTHPR